MRYRLVILVFFACVPHVRLNFPSVAAEPKYDFTSDWVTRNIALWTAQLKHVRGQPNLHALEIGSYEGRSAIWFLENILVHPTSSITCVDIFDDKTYEDRFGRNILASGFPNKVNKIKGPSQKVLRELKWNSYDFVYIDGSHVAKDVLSDAVLSWDLLKVGGIIIFDDYLLWADRYRPWARPQIAVDAVLEIYEPYIEVLHKGTQVVIRKRQAPLTEDREERGLRGLIKTSQRILTRFLRMIGAVAKEVEG